jgi:glycerol-3-phosphate acyltransferase PlsY
MSMGLLEPILWVALAFLSGALPLSVWLGRLALGLDIRRYGDGNPGAANVYRAGGAVWGGLAVLLDFFKGAVPVSAAHYGIGLQGGWLAAVALAVVAGHAWSPFLRFRGGKALAVSFGAWSGLTIWVAPLVLGAALGVWLRLLRVEGWAVLAGMASLGIFFLIDGAQPALWVVWAGNSLLLFWKHRADFQRRPPTR